MMMNTERDVIPNKMEKLGLALVKALMLPKLTKEQTQVPNQWKY